MIDDYIFNVDIPTVEQVHHLLTEGYDFEFIKDTLMLSEREFDEYFTYLVGIDALEIVTIH